MKIPNDKNKALKATYKRVMVPNYSPTGFIPERAKGSYVWDKNDKHYIDLGGGIAVNCLGHSNPDLLKALSIQSKKIWHVSNYLANESATELAKSLTDLTFADKVFFCNSGSEANEAAIKIARRFHYLKNDSKDEIISFTNSFHGRSLLNITLGGSAKHKEGFGPFPESIFQAHFNDLKSVEKNISKKTAAIIVEPIQGESGIQPAKKSFLQGLRELCDSNGIVLIFDEVQSGLGRTGHLFAYMKYGVNPDILTTAKGLGGGLPIGATLVKNNYAQALDVGSHGSTFGGNPLVCAVAIKVLELISQPTLLGEIAEKEEILVNGLMDLSSKYHSFDAIRSAGLWIGCDLKRKQEVNTLIDLCYAEGLIVISAGSSTLRLAPALNIPKEDLKESLIRLEKALAKFSN